jgi:hypothetical protein
MSIEAVSRNRCDVEETGDSFQMVTDWSESIQRTKFELVECSSNAIASLSPNLSFEVKVRITSYSRNAVPSNPDVCNFWARSADRPRAAVSNSNAPNHAER